MASETRFTAVNARERKKLIGSIGSGVRSSQAMNAASRTPPAVIEPSTVALGQPPAGERQQRDADRHVDPEDPLPRDAVDHGAADQRPEGDGEAGDPRPGADRQAAPTDRERIG